LQARMEHEAVTTPKTLRCFAGLSESVVPVRLGDKVIGYLQTGQVMLQAPSEKSFAAAAAGLAKWHQVADLAALRAAYFETRVIDRARYDAVLRLLASFAQHLSLVCNEVMVRQATAEPAAVARARTFIDENLAEDITLEQVARAACTSSFYFCKIFKAATGVTFTDYVARLRVERAKRLLTSSQTRISEAAYAAGFQSLSQFNRVFRRVEGQSPTDYRSHLPGIAVMRAA
jgi:AraC-like DNA-binding protein